MLAKISKFVSLKESSAFRSQLLASCVFEDILDLDYENYYALVFDGKCARTLMQE